MVFNAGMRRFLQYVLVAAALSGTALAQTPDPVFDAARDARQRRDAPALARLSEQAMAQQHPLASWVDYWRLAQRLDQASAEELAAFYARWSGSYVEDRLRNDWLLELGRRRDWAAFALDYPRFLLDDDRSLHCHAISAELALGRPLRPSSTPLKARALQAWLAQRDPDEACTAMARSLLDSKRLGRAELWQKLRRSAEDGRGRTFREAAGLLAPQGAPKSLLAAFDDPARYLTRRAKSKTRGEQEELAVALVRLADSDPARAATLMDSRFAELLPPLLRQWVWSQTAREAALRRQPEALDHLKAALAARDAHGDWSADTQAWAARIALRAGDWDLLQRLVDAMPEALRQDSTWQYWGAQARYRSAPEGPRGDADRSAARAQLQQLVSPLHFYGQLAAEDLGLRAPLPARPAPLSDAERAAAAEHAGLSRALQLIAMGLRSEGVREWNFSIRQLSSQGDRALLAAAQRACDAEVWDRCIHASERSQQQIDLAQRYPMPFGAQISAQARAAGLNPADPFGLIRQESRFVPDARSVVGAGGLMQVMPATARWTARKLGMDWNPSLLKDPDTNLRLGMAYLRMVLDDFDGALPLAAAAYNAGPGRPRRWREGEPLDAAAWAETIPFAETRDYVKKVLANATVYARLLGDERASLRQRLGHHIGPRLASANPINQDLP